jgi:hypothetical protein
MNSYIPNTNPNLTAIRRERDATLSLVPITHWVEARSFRYPVDLTSMAADWSNLGFADFAIHDASDGRVYLRNGSIFEALEAFEKASR